MPRGGNMTTRKFTVANGRRILSEHELLGHLKPKELTKLLTSARVQRFGTGEILFRKGDPGDKLFVVLSGRIMIGTRLGPGKVNVLDVLGEGRIFGEVAVLDGAERAADAVALVESRLMVLERGDFVSFMDDHREAAQRLLAALCERVRSMSEPESYQAVRFEKLPVRLAKKLLLLAEVYGESTRHGVRIDLKLLQGDLGKMTGTSREGINKQMRGWRKQRLIEDDAGTITISNLKQLKRISEAR